ncbi:unnamed protein product [Lactuca saligna]|uniref:Uncharacterized protein n=1 Tax=Lactuca saligna TaxID=75948 RepID=A0AA36E6V4_LACSI|nr:unnamed protein product [Lactuca saligna]
MVKEFYSMKKRCSPEELLSIILGMSKEQKESVRSMGFGALLKMKITDIPLKLGFYVLQNFDSERMVIDIERKELKVTAESVHDMLGIPICGTKLTQLDQWPKDDTSYDEWKQQFKKDSIIRLSAIKNVIVFTTQADFNFKLNFLVLFVNTFYESTSMGRYLEDSDSDKDEDHYVEAYETKISKMLNSFERMNKKLNSKLNDAITYFPEKESFRIFEEKMTNIIGEEKTEGATIFEFPINQTGFEGINLTPIIGQKTNNQKGNEDKEGNENERIKNDRDNNQKQGEPEVKEKDGKNNQNDNDEEKKADDNKETNNHEETIQQTENENLLDKVVNNIVDNVLGIRISDLNMSPVSTGKTNTLAEKEKSEGVHEQGRKVEKTKGDDTGKENSEDRNKGGTKAKNTKDGGEDKHIKTEKGNAEDKGPSKHDLDQPREKKLADAFKSPFKYRITDMKPKLTHQESIVCEWLFNLQGNTLDVVVQTKYGQIT